LFSSMGLNSFFKFVLLILANLFLYFIVYYSLKMENKSTMDHQNRVDIILQQDIFDESEKPIVEFDDATEKHSDIHKDDTDKDELLRKSLLDSSEIDLTPSKGPLVPPLLIADNAKIYSKEEFSSLMASRLAQKEAVCYNTQGASTKSKRDNALKSLADKVYVMKAYDLVWCPVFKAASTNWMRNIIRLANMGEKKEAILEKKFRNQPNQQAREVAPKLKSGKLKSYAENKKGKKMLIVRHPFDRLVSAFRDKLERCTTSYDCTRQKDWYYSKHGSKMVKKYRQLAEIQAVEDQARRMMFLIQFVEAALKTGHQTRS